MERMMQPSTLAHEGRVPALRTIVCSRLFLYFSVLTFTFRTALNNARARVAKSRTGGVRSDLSCQTKACRMVARSIPRWRFLPSNKLRGLRAVYRKELVSIRQMTLSSRS